MLGYRTFEEIVDHPGLRIVLVKSAPSPWGQAAKTIFEIKGLDYVAAPWLRGEPNADIVAWGGEASAPIVAWAKEKPINRWIDILYLAERLAPQPSLLPADATQRALMIGLSHEICGQMGIGWGTGACSYLRRRIYPTARRLTSAGWAANTFITKPTRRPPVWENRRIAQSFGDATQITIRACIHYFVGEAVSALDVYSTAFANLLDPLPKEQCPMPDARRAAFAVTDPIITGALDPLLLEHRSRIFREHFRNPMEL